MSESNVDRRDFLKTSAGAAATVGALSMTAASYANIKNANEKKNVAFLGVGGRCQQHVDVILKMQSEGKPVAPYAVCDVWDGDPVLGRGKGRGLYPTAKRCKIPNEKKRVTKDYRHILDLKEVDLVAIATPDHWHAKMAIDAMKAGKSVYCEKPMTRTIQEALDVVETAQKTKTVMTVGVQSMADPTWQKANEYIRSGKIGKVVQGQTSYYRNYIGGQWRYYPLKKGMTPKTIDWPMWLGHKFECSGEKLGPSPKEQPFDRAIWAQWRCYWPFGGGMFTDLFVHQTTHLISAMGVRFPRRVVGGGGIYLEYDGRDVPDVATVVADYDEGCQVIITATMVNDYAIRECIRGRLATLNFTKKNGKMGFEVLQQKMSGGPRPPKGATATDGEFIEGGLQGSDTYALWANFLECVQDGNRDTLSTPELGAAAFSTVKMGVNSYRQGKAFFFDKAKNKPVEADSSWADQWEARSEKRGTPNHIIGWKGGNSGSVVVPPEYQKLEGPWVDGKEPGASDTSGS